MKQLVIILLFLSTMTISAQSKKTKTTCNVEMTKEALLIKTLNEIDCVSINNKTITNFKVRVPKYKSVLVKGNALNDEATKYIAEAIVGDKIVFFDIELEKDEKSSPITITIIE